MTSAARPRWFYCFATGEVFRAEEFGSCPECGLPISADERAVGRHEAGAPAGLTAANAVR